MKKVDILAVGVHPDDIELSCSGTLLSQMEQGYSAALCDLTAGELGSRGSATIRLEEAERARQIFNIDQRVNLGLPDGFLQKDKASLLKLIKVIRACQPTIVFANAIEDRHPDHGKAADFIKEACFLSGLVKIETTHQEQIQEPWRPTAVYHYIQDYILKPDIIVDISGFMETKLKTVLAYSSQFYDPNSSEPETPISSKAFFDGLESRAKHFGRLINCEYGEGFTVNRPMGTSNLMSLF